MRVGVTGHRDIRAYPGLEAAVDAAIRGLGARGADTLVSALAAGSDQLVASRALAAGWALEALLPEEEAPYRARIVSEHAGDGYAALLGHERSTVAHARVPPTDYAGLGKVLVERCDLVFAVLDPRRPDGGVGGTEDVVRFALEAGRPVMQLDPATGLVTEDGGLAADVVAGNAMTREVEAAADAQAVGAKGRMRRRAIAIGALGALAVIFAAVPLAYTPWAHRGWSMAEVAALICAFGLLAWHRRTDARADWVHARTRAELVRRERCLFVGRAGGYALPGGRAESRAARQALLAERIAELGTVAEDQEDATIASAYGTITRAATSRSTPGVPEPALVAWYRRRRVADQEAWFGGQAHARHRQALAWEWGAHVAGGGAVLGAIVVFFGLGHHGAEGAVAHGSAGHEPAAAALPAIAHGAAVALPAVAAACTMVTTLMSDAVDARRYRAAARVLARFRGEPADPAFSPSVWIDQVEAFLLAEHLAWRAEMLSRDVEVP